MESDEEPPVNVERSQNPNIISNQSSDEEEKADEMSMEGLVGA